MKDFEDLLKKNIKVDGKKNNLGDAVFIFVEGKKIFVIAELPF